MNYYDQTDTHHVVYLLYGCSALAVAIVLMVLIGLCVPDLPVRFYLIIRNLLPSWLVFRIARYYIAFANWFKYGDRHFPPAISLELNAHCNRTCYYCPQSVNRLKPKFISQEVFRKFLFRLREMDWTGMVGTHFYGEPLLDKGLEQHIKQLKDFCPKVAVCVFSNGDCLTEERFQSLVKAGVVRFQVTRHPPYSAEWDARMAVLVQRHPTYIRCEAIEQGGLYNRGGLVKVKKQFDLSKGCFMASCGLSIAINGDIMFCCCDYNREEVMGNIFRDRILDAWNKPEYAAARKSVRGGKPVLEICKRCFTINERVNG
jgi:MoaA/NifB/PqqE/SkfB family radical SAM enzyme